MRTQRRSATIGLGTSAVLVLSLAAAPAAQALGPYVISNPATGTCLTNTGGLFVEALPCDGSPSQQWTVTPVPNQDRLFTVANVAAAECLTWQPNDISVDTDPCNANLAAQWWYLSGLNTEAPGTPTLIVTPPPPLDPEAPRCAYPDGDSVFVGNGECGVKASTWVLRVAPQGCEPGAEKSGKRSKATRKALSAL
jgi:hypothetical protein